MKTQNKKGFTIVELVIVIAVIAILAAVLIPTFINLTKKANESADIQACRNMNTFLTTAKVTGDIKSPMDIYDVFKNSGYAVESYTPLSADHHYYYDDQYNQVLYVDTETGEVVYPSEHQGKKQPGHNWYSLSMTVVSMKQPEGNSYSYDSNKITATVANAEEYAFVIDAYNNAGGNTSLTLKLTEDIDLRGAYCPIKETKGDVTIIGNNCTIKNGASNRTLLISNQNAENKDANYNASAFIGKVNNGHTVTIKNVTFDNMNVKTITGGSVALIAARVYGTLEVEDVTIQNSTVIGHRDVSAVAGQIGGVGKLNIKGRLTIKDVKVLTIGGRSSLICRVNAKEQLNIAQNAKPEFINYSIGIYNNPESKQEIEDVAGTTTIIGSEKLITSIKIFGADGELTPSTYGYSSKALVLVHASGNPKGNENFKFYNSVDEFKEQPKK